MDKSRPKNKLAVERDKILSKSDITFITIHNSQVSLRQASLITESAGQLHRLQKIACKSYISGLGDDQDSGVTSKYVINVNIQSLSDPYFVTKVRAFDYSIPV